MKVEKFIVAIFVLPTCRTEFSASGLNFLRNSFDGANRRLEIRVKPNGSRRFTFASQAI